MFGEIMEFYHLTQFERTKNIAVPKSTLLILNDEVKVLEYPFTPPHEIMHLRGTEMVKKYQTQIGSNVKNFKFLSHEDEIFADYFEAVLVRSYLDKIDSQEFLCLPEKIVNYSCATLVDTSILHLNLAPNHKNLSTKLNKIKVDIFPGYKNIIESRTGLFEAIKLYENTGQKTKEIEIVDELLGETNNSIAQLFEIAQLAKDAFQSLLSRQYNLRQHEINVRVQEARELVKLFKEAANYSMQYFEFARNLKKIQIDNPSNFEIVSRKLIENKSSIDQVSFVEFIANYPDIFGYYLPN
jgi:hypothetical protein